MSTAQANAIEVQRWALVDDPCTTLDDLNKFYASPEWQAYLKWRNTS